MKASRLFAAAIFVFSTMVVCVQGANDWDEFMEKASGVKDIEATGVTAKEYLRLNGTAAFVHELDEEGSLAKDFGATAAFAYAAAAEGKYNNNTGLINAGSRALDWAAKNFRNHATEGVALANVVHAYRILEDHAEEDRVEEWRTDLGNGAGTLISTQPEDLPGRAGRLSALGQLYRLGIINQLESIEGDVFDITNDVANMEGTAEDLLARLWLADLLASGYGGGGIAGLSDELEKAVTKSLFLQEEDGSFPMNRKGLNADAAQSALYEIYALFSRAERQLPKAGVYKRAGRRSFQSLDRTVPANQALDPTTSAYLALAHEYARRNPEKEVAERVTPAEIDSLVESVDLRPVQKDVFEPDTIRKTMKEVFRYTVANPNNSQTAGWEKGALYTGIMGAYLQTKDEEYLTEAKRWSEENKWELADNRHGYWFADNQTCAQTYLEIYMVEGGEDKIEHTKKVLDEMVEDTPPGREEWWWCDALYMAPPVFVRLAHVTNDQKYLEAMNEMWWDARDFLYDDEHHLFYRDKNYFDAKTMSGKNVFWSRGNGWVMGGLARVLQYLPEDNEHYDDFVEIYQEMADKLVEIQGEDGLWRSSLLDSEEWPMPETSGTGFFTYSMMWGVNNNLLSREKFLPVIRRGWDGLNRAVHEDGKLGWTQFVAGSPGPVSPYQMREYSPGAFMLAGSEILKFIEKEGKEAIATQ